MEGPVVTRSLPEKTFEHWCSIHLTYRYRAKLLMWWPTSTADIDIVLSAHSWGKRFWLELKTPEWKASAGRHDLSIDLIQLVKYGRQSIPDYYVFPLPPWSGVMSPATTAIWLRGVAPQRLAYESWSSDRWFAGWTCVVPGWALRTALSSQIAGLPTGVKKRSVRVAEVINGNLNWLSPALRAVPIRRWRDFWMHMEHCGDDDWRAQFLLPPGLISAASPSRGDLAVALKQLAKDGKEFNEEVETFNRVADGSYARDTDGAYAVQAGAASAQPTDGFPSVAALNRNNGSRSVVILNQHAIAQ